MLTVLQGTKYIGHIESKVWHVSLKMNLTKEKNNNNNRRRFDTYLKLLMI